MALEPQDVATIKSLLSEQTEQLKSEMAEQSAELKSEIIDSRKRHSEQLDSLQDTYVPRYEYVEKIQYLESELEELKDKLALISASH